VTTVLKYANSSAGRMFQSRNVVVAASLASGAADFCTKLQTKMKKISNKTVVVERFSPNLFGNSP